MITNDLIRSRVLGRQDVPHLVIAFARRRGVLPFLNRATRPGGHWSHTALWDSHRRVFNEALMFEGVVETRQEAWFDRYSETQMIAVPCPNPLAGLMFAQAQIGKGYDYLGALGVPWRRDWQDPERWYCSELDAMVLAAAGRPVFRDPHKGGHPHDLWRVCL